MKTYEQLSLPKLIELKLASGMTAPGRLKDLADVQELIWTLELGKRNTASCGTRCR